MSKVNLITGTSTGFGRDAAERLARRGHHVFATMRDVEGRNTEPRRELERLASAEKLPLRVLELDVTNEESVRSAVNAALHDARRLDVVINNAGYAGIGITEAYTTEQFQQMFDSEFYFTGTVEGVPASAAMTYHGSVEEGGSITAQIRLFSGLQGVLQVDAVVALGGTYTGFVIVR